MAAWSVRGAAKGGAGANACFTAGRKRYVSIQTANATMSKWNNVMGITGIPKYVRTVKRLKIVGR